MTTFLFGGRALTSLDVSANNIPSENKAALVQASEAANVNFTCLPLVDVAQTRDQADTLVRLRALFNTQPGAEGPE
jgi:hypothetical protein